MSDTFVIVGGDAAGMSAASKAKREDPDLDVIVFEKGEWVSYGACGLPYYVKGEIEDIEDLVAVPAEEFREERDVDLRTHHEVTGIDPDGKSVTVEGPDGSFEQPYDELLIATGASAIVPPFDGIDLDGVYTMHSLPEGERLKGILGGEETHPDAEISHPPESVAIVGGGYIGLEMAEAFSGRGLDVSVFEMLPHVLQPFGTDVAEVVEDHLREQEVDLHLDTAVERFVGDDHVTGIEAGGETFDADMVLVGVGVDANSDLAADAEVDVGETGAIATDEYGRTKYEDVFAAGDCAEATNVVTGDPTHVPLALTANRAGRAIGQTVGGGDLTEVGDIAGTAVVKVFDLEVARTGVIHHDEAEEAGFDPVSKTIKAPSRAHYYPGGSPITIRLTADRESGKLLGASMVGEEGVANRIDTVATALHAGMTVEDVEYLDLSYAPPFGPTWDPVLTAAKVLRGQLD
jgi:NADPH-dependent 2,4-dienoyl-CoA reductase/sulfur reductase-like enzyme